MDRRQFLKSLGAVVAGIPAVGLLPTPKPHTGGILNLKPRKYDWVYYTLAVNDSATKQSMTGEELELPMMGKCYYIQQIQVGNTYYSFNPPVLTSDIEAIGIKKVNNEGNITIQGYSY